MTAFDKKVNQIAARHRWNIDLDALADTLKRAQWGQMEIDIITRALAACGLDR